MKVQLLRYVLKFLATFILLLLRINDAVFKMKKPPVIKKILSTCAKSHQYYTSSDCPTCPVCEEARKPGNEFLSQLSAPARRALENNGIKTLQQLSKFSEAEILKFHGMGQASIPKLRNALAREGLSFKK